MKLLLIALLTGQVFAQSCPSETLKKKPEAKTHYSLDLKTKYSEKELSKFGCQPKTSVMSKEQQLTLLNEEFEAKKAKL